MKPTPIKILRYIIALPVEILQMTIIIVAVILGKLFRQLGRVQYGIEVHVYMPVVVVKRFIQGEPLWNVNDLIYMNIQPTTAKAIAIAAADSRVTKIRCQCGDPNCALKDKDLYIAIPPGAVMLPQNAIAPSAVIKRRDRKIGDGTAVTLPNGRYAEAATVEQLNKLERFEVKLATMTRHIIGCDFPGCSSVIASHCTHTSEYVDDAPVPPPCITSLLDAHNWRHDGDDNFCPDHDAPVAVASADATPPTF